MLKKCTCKDAYQDKRYGKRVRVHNAMTDKKKPQEYRCTKCGAVRT
jgi:ribosomal protein L37AE/L43A